MKYDIAEIRETARRELRDEEFRAAVEKEKVRLRSTRWWHRFIPVITIIWRKS